MTLFTIYLLLNELLVYFLIGSHKWGRFVVSTMIAITGWSGIFSSSNYNILKQKHSTNRSI